VLTIALGLGAALWLGGGFVLQQHVAATLPWSDVLSPRLLLDLVRKPLWVAGIVVMVIGQLLGAAALGQGSLALVEPLLAANLLFALSVSALWRRHRLGGREWGGALLLIAGLAGFLLAANPGDGSGGRVHWYGWVVAAASILVLVVFLVFLARRTDLAGEGTLLGTAAGVLFGLQDALTSRAVPMIGHGPLGLLTSWKLYAVLGVALVGLVLGQSAFRAAPLTASLPGLTVAEPLTGIALGAVLFSEPLRLSAPAVLAEVAAFVAIAFGVVLLARSPLIASPAPVTDPHARPGVVGAGVPETTEE
jgi:drug/metabolite transporter (DMT)-like permease